jgi:hypothetical protein
MTTPTFLHTWRFPSRVAALGLKLQLPSDWIPQWLPDEDPDFGHAAYLMPLASVASPNGAVTLSIDARPANEELSVADWAWDLLQRQGLPRPALHEHRVGNLPALVGESAAYSSKGLMHVRFAFVEDGQRLIRLTLRAPYVLADAVDSLWFMALDSLRLDDPFGPTLTLWSPAEDDETALAPNSGMVALSDRA